MEYYRYNSENLYIGVTETEPADTLWSNVPYVDSFIQPKWNGEAWVENGVFDIDLFINQLSAAFDLKFEAYWRSKGYTDLFDLLSHEGNVASRHYAEALGLVKWAHTNWESAIAEISERSNIQEILDGLEPYS